MDDGTLLRALLGAPGLTTGEREAFAGMQARLGRWSALTDRQRAWGQEVGARLALPGVSAPPVPVGRRPGRAAWDPSKRTGRTSGRKLERYAAELSAEIQDHERAQARRKARA